MQLTKYQEPVKVEAIKQFLIKSSHVPILNKSFVYSLSTKMLGILKMIHANEGFGLLL